MASPQQNPTGLDLSKSPPSRLALHSIWPKFIQLWIAAVIAVFFLIRILGSQTAQRIFSPIVH